MTARTDSPPNVVEHPALTERRLRVEVDIAFAALRVAVDIDGAMNSAASRSLKDSAFGTWLAKFEAWNEHDTGKRRA